MHNGVASSVANVSEHVDWDAVEMSNKLTGSHLVQWVLPRRGHMWVICHTLGKQELAVLNQLAWLPHYTCVDARWSTCAEQDLQARRSTEKLTSACCLCISAQRALELTTIRSKIKFWLSSLICSSKVSSAIQGFRTIHIRDLLLDITFSVGTSLPPSLGNSTKSAYP